MRVLVIDNEENIILTNKLSSEKGIDGKYYEVITERNYEKVLDLLNHEYFEIVLVEMFASDKTRVGLEIVQELGNKSPVTIVITASPSLSNCVECVKIGCWDYLDKKELGTSFQVLIISILKGCEYRVDNPFLGKPDPNDEWISNNWDKLESIYPNKTIAVFDCKVIAHSPLPSDIYEKYILGRPTTYYIADPNEDFC